MKLFVFVLALSCSNAAPQESTTEGGFEPGTSTPGSRFDTTTPGSRFDTTTPGSRFDTTTPGSRFDTTTPGSRFDTTTPGSRFDTTTPGSRSDLTIPSFKISGYSRSGIPDVTVGFENGVSHQMVLEPFSNSPCNFIGKMSNDPSSSVAVTGCLNQPGDKMHITLLSGIQSRSLIYSLDFDGQVTALENPTKYQTAPSGILPPKSRDVGSSKCEDPGMAKHQDKMGDEDEDDFMELEALLSERNANDRSWPGEVYAYVKLQYDSTLKGKLAADGTDFNTWADAVMTHVQTHYRHPSLPTKIQFKYDLSEAIYKDASMPSTDFLTQWSQIGQEDADDRVDLYVAFGYDEKDHSCDPSSPNWTGSGCSFTTGLAYVGGACTDGIRNSMNEWSDSPASTGLTAAHEMGHNFGMSHDFDAKHGGDNGACNGQGIMSYGDFPSQWSSCSVADFTGYYNSRDWGNTCLKSWEAFCGDSCPGPKCQINPDNICQMTGPNDGLGVVGGDCSTSPYSSYLFDFCKKTCGKC